MNEDENKPNPADPYDWARDPNSDYRTFAELDVKGIRRVLGFYGLAVVLLGITYLIINHWKA